jgi:hypothetical protein
MGSKTKFVGNVCLILRRPWFRGSLHERAMLAVVHCTVTAMLNLQTEHQAWPAKSISIVTLNNCQLNWPV